MKASGFEEKLLIKYLRLLGVSRQSPSIEYLNVIVRAQISKIPFENISKLLYKKRLRLNSLIDFELYLEGIEKYNFGGTCYANNFYFNQLLLWLGFNVKLCGADMKEPDVHLVNIIKIENREFLVDTGYAAPFFEPLPLGLLVDYTLNNGNDHYVLKPQNDNIQPQLELYRNGELIHGYKVNPRARNISEFRQIIEDSFKEDSTFMQSLLITRFDSDKFITIHNMSVIETNRYTSKVHSINTIDQLTSIIENHCGIPKTIVLESIQGLQMHKDSWG